jgi:actin-related protein 7
MDFDKAAQSAADDERSFEWKGRTLTMGRERYQVGEALFQPSLYGSESPGLHELVAGAVHASDADIRPLLLEHIVLTGGGSALVGLAERLVKEVESSLSASGTQPEVVTPPSPQAMAWAGAATTASLPTTNPARTFFTQAEYDDLGPSGVHKKCWL